jgi:hypothetical protein
MKVRATTGYSLVDDDGREFPTEFRAVEWLDPFVRENDDGSVTIRYAVQDNDPMEHEWQEGVEFLLFNSGGERDEWIEENLDTCKCGWHLVQHDDDHRREAHDCGFDGPCDEPEPATEWTDRMFWVERYEHGLVNYALTNESSRVDRGWDVAPGVAVLTVPDDVPDPEAFARAVLEEYTDWCNGDVYGVVEQTYHFDQRAEDSDGEPIGEWESVKDDACWGFIGQSYTETVLKEGL